MEHRLFQELQVALYTNIRKARNMQGMTQEQAALGAGIDYKRWQKIEKGQANVTMKTLCRIAKILDVLPESLICVVGSNAPAKSVKGKPQGKRTF